MEMVVDQCLHCNKKKILNYIHGSLKTQCISCKSVQVQMTTHCNELLHMIITKRMSTNVPHYRQNKQSSIAIIFELSHLLTALETNGYWTKTAKMINISSSQIFIFFKSLPVIQWKFSTSNKFVLIRSTCFLPSNIHCWLRMNPSVSHLM
jgi:hypothetical protein